MFIYILYNYNGVDINSVHDLVLCNVKLNLQTQITSKNSRVDFMYKS